MKKLLISGLFAVVSLSATANSQIDLKNQTLAPFYQSLEASCQGKTSKVTCGGYAVGLKNGADMTAHWVAALVKDNGGALYAQCQQFKIRQVKTGVKASKVMKLIESDGAAMASKEKAMAAACDIYQSFIL